MCSASEVAVGRDAELGLSGWHGLTWTRVHVVGETPKRFRIEAIREMRLAGPNRWLKPGKTALVPKHALRGTPCEAEG